MPVLHRCPYPGCRTLSLQVGRCPRHTTQDAREDIQRRGTATARGYGGKWREARAGYLAKHPLCSPCAREGRTTRATHVDHITAWQSLPTQEEQRRAFWDSGNWQGLCASHHAEKTTREDMTRRADGTFGGRR